MNSMNSKEKKDNKQWLNITLNKKHEKKNPTKITEIFEIFKHSQETISFSIIIFVSTAGYLYGLLLPRLLEENGQQ